MWKLTEKDAKTLLDLAKEGQENDLNIAIDHLTDEIHFVGFMDGVICISVGVMGVYIVSKLVGIASDRWLSFANKAIGEFIVSKGK